MDRRQIFFNKGNVNNNSSYFLGIILLSKVMMIRCVVTLVPWASQTANWNLSTQRNICKMIKGQK